MKIVVGEKTILPGSSTTSSFTTSGSTKVVSGGCGCGKKR
jgi:hypothetical protein